MIAGDSTRFAVVAIVPELLAPVATYVHVAMPAHTKLCRCRDPRTTFQIAPCRGCLRVHRTLPQATSRRLYGTRGGPTLVPGSRCHTSSRMLRLCTGVSLCLLSPAHSTCSLDCCGGTWSRIFALPSSHRMRYSRWRPAVTYSSRQHRCWHRTSGGLPAPCAVVSGLLVLLFLCNRTHASQLHTRNTWSYPAVQNMSCPGPVGTAHRIRGRRVL